MLHLVFCWHFHQPDYRDADGIYQLPWTYLHAVKDYADMAAHLEASPDLQCVVNFVPTLTAQLRDYCTQFETGELRDPLLQSLLANDLYALPAAQKRKLIEQCFKVNHATMLEPFPAYKRLYTLWKAVDDGNDDGNDGDNHIALNYLSEQYLADLVMWYHLVWTGETVRRAHPELLAWLKQAEAFSLKDRHQLFDLYGDVIASVLPRYQQLSERGQIELSSTPHSHPILPLLLDFHAARDVRSQLELPQAHGYPGGEARARAHIDAAIRSHQAEFGQPPSGFWPAEGGVSDATIQLFSQAGVKWAASGEAVLRHSLAAAHVDLSHKPAWCCKPFKLPNSATALFFRDDHLSDLIGFEYKSWHGRDASRHFIQALDDVRRHATTPNPVVSIILDGENAWEYFPFNGYYFLSDLFAEVVQHPLIHSTTFSDYLDLFPQSPVTLPHVLAGSWVYGDFTTWMGDSAKNRAWDWLVAAKQVYDGAIGTLPPDQQECAEALLKSCESSDWFWWFGDYNPADAVDSFDRVYRQKLKRLYQTLRVVAPDYLDHRLCLGAAARQDHTEAGGVMRRGGA
jgi:alpha-amylase/alpha-mannosidase (GH57 family)